jgi:hypothetical protein
MRVFRTEDGYTFYEQADGQLWDSITTDGRDLAYVNLREFEILNGYSPREITATDPVRIIVDGMRAAATALLAERTAPSRFFCGECGSERLEYTAWVTTAGSVVLGDDASEQMYCSACDAAGHIDGGYHSIRQMIPCGGAS